MTERVACTKHPERHAIAFREASVYDPEGTLEIGYCAECYREQQREALETMMWGAGFVLPDS